MQCLFSCNNEWKKKLEDQRNHRSIPCLVGKNERVVPTRDHAVPGVGKSMQEGLRCSGDPSRGRTSAVIVATGTPKIKGKDPLGIGVQQMRPAHPDLLEHLKCCTTKQGEREGKEENKDQMHQFINSHEEKEFQHQQLHYEMESFVMQKRDKMYTEEREDKMTSHRPAQYGYPEKTTAYNGIQDLEKFLETRLPNKKRAGGRTAYPVKIERHEKISDEDMHERQYQNILLPSPDFVEKNTKQSRGEPGLHKCMNQDDCAADAEEKPPYSFIALIAMAILSSPHKKLLLADIYKYITDTFSYFRSQDHSWKNSIRHNLSLNDCFVKAERGENGKGSYWRIHPDNFHDFARGDYRRRKPHRITRKRNGYYCYDSCHSRHRFTSKMPSFEPYSLMADRCKDVTSCTWSTHHPPVCSVSSLPVYQGRHSALFPWKPTFAAETFCKKTNHDTDRHLGNPPNSLANNHCQKSTLTEELTNSVLSWQETLEKLQREMENSYNLKDESLTKADRY